MVKKASLLEVLFIAIFMCQINFNYALDPKKEISSYKNDVWQMEQGLPQNSVFAILQSYNGYMWIGTEEGLLRFDGIKFDIFDRDNTSAFKSNYIYFLVEDKYHTIWIGTDGGGILSFNNGVFKSYTTVNGLSSNNVHIIVPAHDGSLWIGTENGLNRLKNGIIEKIALPKTSSSSSVVNAIIEDRKGQIWVGTDGGGLILFKKNGPGFTVSIAGLSGYHINSILEDHSGNLWVGTAHSGLIQLKGKNKILYSTHNGLSKDNVSCLYEDKNEALWIGTYAGGLNRLYENKISVLNVNNGLSDDVVNCILEDREGNLWVGTYSGGFNILKDRKATIYGLKNGLSGENIRGILQDRTGKIWICTNNGINLFKNGEFKSYIQKNGAGNNLVYSVCEGKDSTIWFGTFGGGLISFKNGHFKTYTTRDGLLSNFIRCVYADSKGNIWIGAQTPGLVRFSNNHFKIYKKNGSLSKGRVSAILEDRIGNLWVGTVGGGVNRFKNGNIKVFDEKNGLFNNVILSIYEDQDGILWFGTYAGLIHYNNEKFSIIKKKDGLFDRLIYVILEDNKRNFWMSCNKGISMVRRQDLEDFVAGKISHFDHKTYGINVECNGVCQPAGWKTKHGKLWFPTLKGIYIIDPVNINVNNIPSPVVIENIVINKKNYSSESKAIAPPGRGNVDINYVGLSFIEPKKVLFKYMLKGYDTEWRDAGIRRSAYYTNLPPKSYTFKIKACNNDGLWNPKPTQFQFSLIPHFYQTWWFYFLCVIFTITLLIGFFMYRLNSLKKRKEELANLVDERTKQLKKSNEQLGKANNQLEQLATHDALTGIYNRRKFFEYYKLEWRRSIRNNRPVSVILIDVDFFKLYNDTYGHQAGDECLKKIAYALEHTVNRPGDISARYGGEEFIILLSETSSKGAADVAEKLRRNVKRMSIVHETSSVSEYVTISLGCSSTMPTKGADSALLVNAADNALYKSKKDGRNRVTVGSCLL